MQDAVNPYGDGKASSALWKQYPFGQEFFKRNRPSFKQARDALYIFDLLWRKR